MSQKTLNITKDNLLKACSGAFLAVALLCGTSGSAGAQALVTNNGAVMSINTGAIVIVRTGDVDNNGLLSNAGSLTIEGEFLNRDTATGGGAAGLYKVQDNWVNNGTYTANQSNVELYGANQLITGTNPTTFYNLTLTGTGIKSLRNVDATVSNVLALNGLELATETNTLFVTNTATAAITRTTGYVSSLGAGRLSRMLAGTGVYLYPTGSSTGTTRYRPLEVTPSTATAQTLEVRLANVDATTEGFNRTTKEADICEVNPDFYHLIGHTAGGTDNVALAFYYDAAADGDFKGVAHWQNVPQWEAIGPATAGTSGGLSSLTVPAWNVFNPEAFALIDAIEATATITDATCNGTETGEIDLNVDGGSGNYSFVWSNTPSDTTQDLTNVGAGNYNVTVTDANNCSVVLSGLVVAEPNALTLTASADTTIPIGYSVELDVLSTTGGTGTLAYEWTPGATLSSPTSATTNATPTETTKYTVTGTDAKGCIAIDTVLVTVDFNLVAIPDGFTPDGNGTNDRFIVHFSPAIELVELKIFNRWGQLIAEENKWDGTYKDKKQPMDTYVYQLVFRMPDGSLVNYSGDFLLIR